MFQGMFLNLQSQLQSLLFTAMGVLPAIVIHEYAHGWISYKLGDPTAKQVGRLTLNPLKHLDPVGVLCMMFFRVGWAKPVPINPWYYKNKKKGIIAVSLAGPLANFIFAFAMLFAEGLLMKYGIYSSTIGWFICQLCYYSAIINIGLGLFNLIPIPPLDGSKAVEELWEKAVEFYYHYQPYWRWILMLLIVTGVLSKPLGFLNKALLNCMWQLVELLL